MEAGNWEGKCAARRLMHTQLWEGAGGAGVQFEVPLAGIRQQGPAVMVPYVPVNLNPPVQGAVPPQVPRVTATVEVHTVQDSVAKIMSTNPPPDLVGMSPFFSVFLAHLQLFHPYSCSACLCMLQGLLSLQ